MSAKRRSRGSPDTVRLLFSRATQAHQAGDLDTAQALYADVLRASPRDFGALYCLGCSYAQQGRYLRGVPLLEQALAVRPDYAEAHSNLADALNALARHDEALAHGERAVALDPASAEACNNLGNALHALGRQDEAIARYRQALALKPAFAEALSNLGRALHVLDRPEEAIALYQQALALKPALAAAHCNLGDALQSLDQCAEAIAHYERAIALEPAFAAAHSNLGNALHSLQRSDEALVHYTRALACKADFAEARANMSLALLALGRYAEGWPRYEERWSLKGVSGLRDVHRPLWPAAEAIAGRQLLIQCEQGLGDAILMSRYVGQLEQRGARCTIQAPEPLMDLLRRSFPRCRVVSLDSCPAEVEWRIPMMSLPLAMRTFREADIPNVVPYLSADARRAADWGARLAARGKRAVGLAWRGNPRYGHDTHRSLGLATLQRLLAREDLHFVALAHDLSDAETAELARHDNVTIPGAEAFSFDDLAALVSVLDLVISVDSSPAHLAGALGRPTWVLLSTRPLWCWQLGRSDSPWYPTARLFRQTTPGGWAGVVDEVSAALSVP